MRSSLLILAALSALPAVCAQWAPIAPLPVSRSDHTATELGGVIYIAGGCNGAQNCDFSSGYCSCTSYTPALTSYTPSTNAYASLAVMPTPRYRHLACPLPDGASGMVVFGGRTLPADTMITAIDIYTVATNTWHTLGVPYPPALGSDNSCTTASNGKIYVMGGYDAGYTATNVMYALTLSSNAQGGSFVQVASMPSILGDFSSTMDDLGAIHVLGGYISSADPNWVCRPTTTHFVYTPTSDTWTTAPSLPMALAEKDDAILLRGRLYTIGGETKSKTSGCNDTHLLPLANVFSYDPLTAQWRNETSLPVPVMRTASTLVDNVIYLFGGQGTPIDGAITVPLRYAAYSYGAPAPPAAPWYVTYSAGAMAGGIVGTLLVTLLLVAVARCCWLRRKASMSSSLTEVREIV